MGEALKGDEGVVVHDYFSDGRGEKVKKKVGTKERVWAKRYLRVLVEQQDQIRVPELEG